MHLRGIRFNISVLKQIRVIKLMTPGSAGQPFPRLGRNAAKRTEGFSGRLFS